ncbi:IQ calmodulin-binding motif-containing protein [Legionella micdadei]|uniref:IQ calmodulin-binding motif-containing protein n=1 Tax=Legionella micdadei TaxID=451 RepID=UPI0009EF7730|nr:IQ calmodulin-binding motif-containing protein [Legionella micdadei]ARG99107.1 hypothetical protein B6V88_00900 [Legionella micdadei]
MGKDLNQTQAALMIQKIWRGHQTRKKYLFKQLPKAGFFVCKTYIVGNDPKIRGLEPYKTSEGKIALVATSGLRSLDLICTLGNKESTPKLIIVDYSSYVVSFWRKLRELVESSQFSDNSDFEQAFVSFLNKNKGLYYENQDQIFDDNRNLNYENQNPVVYMKELIEHHSLEFVLSVIKHSTIIAQSWQDEGLFYVLKNIIDLNNIEEVYAYPSNIEACGTFTRLSIKLLDPKLTISTNYPSATSIPDRVFLEERKKADSSDWIDEWDDSEDSDDEEVYVDSEQEDLNTSDEETQTLGL